MHIKFKQLEQKMHHIMCTSLLPRQSDIGTEQRLCELEMSMSSAQRVMGTIVAKKQNRLQWARHLDNGGLYMVPSLASGLRFGMPFCLIRIHFGNLCIRPHLIAVSNNKVMSTRF